MYPLLVVLNLKEEIYSLTSFLAINSKLQSSEPRDKNKQKTTKKDGTQPISTSKNNVLIAKLHAALKTYNYLYNLQLSCCTALKVFPDCL